jgi:uncharacterized membrane protein YbhN (UPF0104 family)
VKQTGTRGRTATFVGGLANRGRMLYRSHRRALTIAAAAVATIVLGLALVGQGDEFSIALDSAPATVLLAAVALQLIALLSRTEAWHVSVVAAGGTAGRRRLYRASSMGFVGSLVNAQLGVAARIAALRRSASARSPGVAPLIGAEFPIMAIEAGLGALASVTLVGPLGLPWYTPLVAVAATLLVSAALRSVAMRTRRGFARGLAVLRSHDRHALIFGLVMVAVLAQIARNWMLLHAVGVDASLFDAVAVLIGLIVLAQLPLGPTTGAAAAILILGPHGVAAVAAAGVLLTATGTAGGLAFAGWALADRAWCGTRLRALRGRIARGRPAAAAVHLRGVLAALPDHECRIVEIAYFGGLTRFQIAQALGISPRP